MAYKTQYHDKKYDPKADIEFELQTVSRNDGFGPDQILREEELSVEFIPRYYPERVIQDKERDLMREKGICLGEYVNDVGAKNREFRVSGKIITPELKEFHKLIDLGAKYDLICMQWQGEVLLKNSELEGPIGIDAETQHWMYKYQLDLVSSGDDEQHGGDNGILNRGT